MKQQYISETIFIFLKYGRSEFNSMDTFSSPLTMKNYEIQVKCEQQRNLIFTSSKIMKSNILRSLVNSVQLEILKLFYVSYFHFFSISFVETFLVDCCLLYYSITIDLVVVVMLRNMVIWLYNCVYAWCALDLLMEFQSLDLASYSGCPQEFSNPWIRHLFS